MGISFALASGCGNCYWKFRLDLEDLSAANVCGNGDLDSYFNFWQHRKFIKQVGIICDWKNISCHQNDFISEYILDINAVLLYKFRLNSLNTIESETKANFQSPSVFDFSTWNSTYADNSQPWTQKSE